MCIVSVIVEIQIRSLKYKRIVISELHRANVKASISEHNVIRVDGRVVDNKVGFLLDERPYCADYFGSAYLSDRLPQLLENEPVKGLIVEKLVNNAVKHVYGTANDYEIDSFYQFLRKLVCVARLKLDRLIGWIVSGVQRLRPRTCTGLVFE